jgi:DAK2 domain fusion protein YloV
LSIQCAEKVINGEVFEKMIKGAAANLHENVQTVNDLNVFPIPDGDTGENMFLTLKGGLEGLKSAEENEDLSQKASAVASGMLLGARGNSGVILSQLFFGLSEGLKGCTAVGAKELGAALLEGVRCAYGAVAHPVEGTVLTVAREAAEFAVKKTDDETTLAEFFDNYLSEMRESLDRTPTLLPVLEEAGVIDSGGAGLLYIVEGFCKALAGESFDVSDASVDGSATVDFSKFDENCVMTYGYCTELLLRLQNSKCSPDDFSVEELIAFLESIGDSVVAFKTGTIVKIHVHTLTPWRVLEHCQGFGEYLTVKVENMTLQHNETVKEETKKPRKPKKKRTKFATVTVAAGEGVQTLFRDMGADEVISGGQTNNPSSEDFVEAFDSANADVIFVLPNNGNIILAAKQAAEIYEGSDVRVIETKSIGAGYSALEMLDYSSDDPDEIEARMTEDMKGSVTGMIARSVRTTSVSGVKVEKDDYMGFTGGEMVVSMPEKIDAARALCKKITEGRGFLIAIHGTLASEDERAAVAEMASELDGVEYYEIDGGQDVYDFIFIAE